MPLKYILLPASTKILTPLQSERYWSRFRITCYWFFLFVCILSALWRGCDVQAQEQSGADLSQNSAPSALPQSVLPQSVPHDARTEPADAWLARARTEVQAGSF